MQREYRELFLLCILQALAFMKNFLKDLLTLPLAASILQDKQKCFKTRRGEIQTGYNKEVFYNKGGGALEDVAKSGGGCPIPADIKGQARQDLSI